MDFLSLSDQAWRHVLARLPPRDVSIMAMVCSNLAKAASELTSARVVDATGGSEKFPIPYISKNSSDPRYPYFRYTRHAHRGGVFWGLAPLLQVSSVPSHMSQETISEPICDCNRTCDDPNECMDGNVVPVYMADRTENVTEHKGVRTDCTDNYTPYRRKRRRMCGVTVSGRPAYDKNGRLAVMASHLLSEEEEEEEPPWPPALVLECGSTCGCSMDCPNRVAQKGVSVHLAVIRHSDKGWALHTREELPKGTFVCEYAGELLTTEEAQNRQREYDAANKDKKLKSKGQYIMVIQEHLPSGDWSMRLNIDPTLEGNVGRFLNHSCDGGNVATVLVRVAGAVVPIVAFFTTRDIRNGEELTYAYGSTNSLNGSKNLMSGCFCFCGSKECQKVLPSEQT